MAAEVSGYLSRAGVAESGLESLLSVTKTKSRKSSAQDWLRQAANLERNNRAAAIAERKRRRLHNSKNQGNRRADDGAREHAARGYHQCARRRDDGGEADRRLEQPDSTRAESRATLARLCCVRSGCSKGS